MDSLDWNQFCGQIHFDNMNDYWNESIACTQSQNLTEIQINDQKLQNKELEVKQKQSNSKTKNKNKKTNKKNLIDQNIICLIVRMDAIISLKYLDSNQNKKESKFQISGNATAIRNNNECKIKENNIYLTFSGILFRMAFYKTNNSIEVYIELTFETTTLQKSSLFEHFSRLDSKYFTNQINPCSFVAEYPLNYSYWCPLKQIFQFKNERQELIVSLQISNLFIDSFRNATTKQSLKPIFSCIERLAPLLQSNEDFKDQTILRQVIESDPNESTTASQDYILIGISLIIITLIVVMTAIIIYNIVSYVKSKTH